VPQVDDFCAGGLHEPPHKVDSGIVPIEEGGCRHDSDRVGGAIGGFLGLASEALRRYTHIAKVM